MMTLKAITLAQKRQQFAQRKRPVPAACLECEHYVARRNECRVLLVLLDPCFVRNQAQRNAARGIEAGT